MTSRWLFDMTNRKIRVLKEERDRKIGCCLLIFVHFLFWISFTYHYVHLWTCLKASIIWIWKTICSYWNIKFFVEFNQSLLQKSFFKKITHIAINLSYFSQPFHNYAYLMYSFPGLKQKWTAFWQFVTPPKNRRIVEIWVDSTIRF